MINLKLVRENPEALKKSLKNRNNKFDVDNLLKLDTQYREINLLLEKNNNLKNVISKEIGIFISKKDIKSADIKKMEMEKINNEINFQQEKYLKLKDELNGLLMLIPNILCNDVPNGLDENDNVEVKKKNQIPSFSFKHKNHWEIGIDKNILDLETSSVLTGTRFSIYKGKGAKLIRALQSLTLDMHTKMGYEEYITPLILNSKSLIATGQLPKFKEDLFQINHKDYYLSPTLEVQLINLYRDQIIEQNILPIKATSSSYNFRSEAGAAGKDVKGVLRQHQFIKTEMINICEPKDSYNLLNKMVDQACSVLDVLEIPYRVVKLCSGDTGFASTLTYDIEVWMPSYNTYREISSCSNCEDFQARRAMIRYNDKENNKKNLVHTLNGTGVSIDRLWIAIIENFQDEHGNIIMPKALIKYLEFDKI